MSSKLGWNVKEFNIDFQWILFWELITRVGLALLWWKTEQHFYDNTEYHWMTSTKFWWTESRRLLELLFYTNWLASLFLWISLTVFNYLATFFCLIIIIKSFLTRIKINYIADLCLSYRVYQNLTFWFISNFKTRLLFIDRHNKLILCPLWYWTNVKMNSEW